jgi:hypothetical protein
VNALCLTDQRALGSADFLLVFGLIVMPLDGEKHADA